MSLDVFLSDLVKFWRQFCLWSVSKMIPSHAHTQIQSYRGLWLYTCILKSVCILCSQLEFLAISPLSFIRDLGPKGLWVQTVYFFFDFNTIPLLLKCISVMLFFLMFVCLFASEKAIFWNGLGVTASRGSTVSDTISSASAGPAAGLWWRIRSSCTCPGGF